MTHSRGGALRRLLIDAGRVDRSQSDPVVSLRNAVGLVIPLLIAFASGNVAGGTPAAIGALQTAFADRPGPYRLRLVRMVGTAVIAGLVGGLASGFGHNTTLSVVLLAICAFAAGQLLSAGPAAAQLGTAATACAIVLGHLPQSPVKAVQLGLLVVAGGLIQTALAVAAWPLGRHRPERLAIAAVYEQIAGLARQPVGTSAGPPVVQAMADARATLDGRGHDHGPSVEAYRVLLGEAERLRHNVLTLAAYAERLPQSVIPSVLAELAGVLDVVVRVLTGNDPLRDAERETAIAHVERIGAARDQLGGSLTERAAASRIDATAGQLRAVIETTRTGAGEGRENEDAGEPLVRLPHPIEVIRANLDLRSSALRHATRLTLLIPATDIVLRLAGFDRAYWVSLTILVVLRPDFGSTAQRAFARVIGTLIGLAVGSLVLHYLLGDHEVGVILLLGVAFFGMRLAGPKNIALGSICLSVLVVCLLFLAGYPAHTTFVERSVATAIGGGIALVASLLWPSWERAQIRDQLADLIGAYRDYL
ncbi:MAG: FUSC family protein, partial [Actinobacteria bacterium]|nr:FUSC family protein [Actinomycetota bacterium]